MKRFWRRDGRLAELEGELRARRTGAPPTFVRALARRAGGETRWLRPRARIALVAGLLVVALVAVASAGGFSLAKSSTSSAAKAVGWVLHSSSSKAPRTLADTPAAAQYKRKCGRAPKEKCEIETSDVSQKEGNAGCTNFVFTIKMTNGPSDEPVIVGYTTVDKTATAGSDYVAKSGSVTFAPGETVKTVTICVIGDTVREKDEQFLLRLTALTPNNSKITGNNPVVGTIQNDDR